MKGRSFSLKPFPSDGLDPKFRITGDIERHSDILSLSYALFGPLVEIIIPAPEDVPSRKYSLWEETCFEFFIGTGISDQYWEFNLSPSGHWNVYLFSSYRKGMQEETAFTSLPLSLGTHSETLRLSLQLDLKKIIPAGQAIRIAVSAVIKERNGKFTYWALSHPGAQPDFHRTEGFIVEV